MDRARDPDWIGYHVFGIGAGAQLARGFRIAIRVARRCTPSPAATNLQAAGGSTIEDPETARAAGSVGPGRRFPLHHDDGDAYLGVLGPLGTTRRFGGTRSPESF